MPFTFAHPLYALPAKLVVRRLSMTGLILGSMSPDFEYFLALEPYATIGHSWPGFIVQALPLSVLLALLFHFVVKEPLAQHLPSWLGMDRRAHALAVRGSPVDMRRPAGWLNYIVAVLIGFVSHLFVDAFTHRYGYFVVRYEWLQDSIFGYQLYKLLQHGLSLLGLAVLLLLVIRAFAGAPIQDTQTQDTQIRPASRKAVYWLIVAGSMVVTVALKFIVSGSANLLGMAVVSSISGLLLGIAAASIWTRWQQIKLR